MFILSKVDSRYHFHGYLFLRRIKWVLPPLPACGSCHRRCLDLTREGSGIFLSQCGHILCSGCKPGYDWRHDRLYKDCPECSDKIVILTEFNRDWVDEQTYVLHCRMLFSVSTFKSHLNVKIKNLKISPINAIPNLLQYLGI